MNARDRRHATGGRQWRAACSVLLAAVLLAGCARSTPLPRSLKGQLEYEQAAPAKIVLKLTPPFSTAAQDGVEVTIRYASENELNNFFSNKMIFGKYAGDDPYPDQTIVLYVRIANKSGQPIRVAPEDFVLIDDLGIQYVHLSPDDISAMYESRGNFWGFAKSTGDLAPGYYGAPFKVAGVFSEGSGRRANYLVRQARLTGGTVHDQVTYDGYVAFPRPHPNAKTLKIILANFKLGLNAADEPTVSRDFTFDFAITPVTETP